MQIIMSYDIKYLLESILNLVISQNRFRFHANFQAKFHSAFLASPSGGCSYRTIAGTLALKDRVAAFLIRPSKEGSATETWGFTPIVALHVAIGLHLANWAMGWESCPFTWPFNTWIPEIMKSNFDINTRIVQEYDKVQWNHVLLYFGKRNVHIDTLHILPIFSTWGMKKVQKIWLLE